MLYINILIGCEILGVPFALEAADNSRFWQASALLRCEMLTRNAFDLSGILPASVRCDGLHVHAQKTKSKEDALALAMELLSPFYNEIAWSCTQFAFSALRTV